MLVSITSVGAGALGTTALLILYPKLPVARIAGSDIAHAVPLTLIAGIGHWLMGSVDFTLMLALLVGSIPGIIVGSMVATRTSDAVLRPVLAMTLLLVCGQAADRLERRVDGRERLHHRGDPHRGLDRVRLDAMLEQHALVAVDAHAAAVHRRDREAEQLELVLCDAVLRR